MISENIRLLRKTANLTQKQLADMLGIAPNTIGMYEQGRRAPDLDLVVKLTEIFKVSADYLLGSITNQELTHVSEFPHSINKEKEEIWSLYEQLDPIDRGEVRGEIKGMLRHEKYALTQKEIRA